MAPLTRSARTASSRFQVEQPPAPEIINLDDDDESMNQNEPLNNIEEVNEQVNGEVNEEEDERMDEDTDNVNGNELSETGSVFPMESSLKSVMERSMIGRKPDSPQLFTAAGAQEAFLPLRRTADRVTRQIEAFADKLDQFKRKNSTDEFQNIQAAYKLVESYRDLANNAIKDITKQNTIKRAKSGFRTSLAQDDDAKYKEELKRFQLEADTWRLLSNLISIDGSTNLASFKEGRQTAFQILHRYSSDREIWEQFLGADQYALECVLSLRWLEETYKTSDSNAELDALIADMEAKADRGQGLWAHGWLFTKETIKAHKRLRVWPHPLEPTDDAATRTLLRDGDEKPLITQLDPDAPVRQKHTLQPQDGSHERATWMTCWKMLRQGERWTKIREWAESSLENWRAVSMCGSSVDPHTSNTRTPVDDGLTRMMSSRAHDSWRSACYALSQNPSTDDYEQAVYALLCGDTDAALKVCTSSDDYLYVYLNRVVLARYEDFCKQFHRKLEQSPNTAVAFKPEPAGHAELQKFFEYMRGDERVGVEARTPFRQLQATILSKSYDSYFCQLAQAVSQVNMDSSGQSIIPEMELTLVNDSYLAAANDNEIMKMATHAYLIVQSIGYARTDTDFFETASVIVAGYIANLKKSKLFDLIPLYASLLPTDMGHRVFSKILIDITDPQERKQQIRLMQKHSIDISAVLDTQWSWLSTTVSSIEHSRVLSGYSRVVGRPDGSRVLLPPKKGLIGEGISDEDDKLIRSLEWLRCAGGQWPKICQLGGWLYRKFFVSGNLAAAVELSHRMLLSDLSHESFGVDLFNSAPSTPFDELPSSPNKSKRSSHRRSHSGSNTVFITDHGSAFDLALSMFNLETLALCFNALNSFAGVYDLVSKTQRRRDSVAVQDHLLELQQYLEAIEACIAVMVDEWLLPSENEEEERDYEHIRRTYVPDILLDYHNVLYYSSHTFEQPNLLSLCMTVAIWAASTPQVTKAFVDSQRMAELMDVLALSSKAMVLTDPKQDRVSEDGQTLALWRVSTAENDDGKLVEHE
ncbi:hypothetical protein N7495_002667 [Penicillium taxi]|uniref:uncharacterized protein n=1 Tax=Penicillium taxi TaxID=168475 RepID=UPI002545BCB9|nr:uncharacterized protein N7495_002667 [Penicillium taxi]KAJ5902139.1 hypothetical protein N7495_002667 [Penicillium taxi]